MWYKAVEQRSVGGASAEGAATAAKVAAELELGTESDVEVELEFAAEKVRFENASAETVLAKNTEAPRTRNALTGAMLTIDTANKRLNER